MKKSIKEVRMLEAYETLKQFRNKNFHVVIRSVSKSGMSRKMDFYVIDGDRLLCLTSAVAHLLGDNTDSKGYYNVSGCGMDMVFSVLSNMNYKMATLDTGKTISELLETKECGERIYDTYFTNANRYSVI